jgi:PAS domain S-box-containing protein
VAARDIPGASWNAMSAAAMLALGVCAVLPTCRGAIAAEPPVLSASEIDYPPFCSVDRQGGATGFSVDLLRAALKAMNRDVSFRTGMWSEVKGWLERGEVAVLPLVGRTPEREAAFDFTFSYMTLHGAIVVRDGTSGIRGLEDLRGRQVAVMKGDNAEEFLRREDRGITLVPTATFQDALRELSRGRHDAVVIQRLVAMRLIQETGLPGLRIVGGPVPGFQQDFCFAVREGDKDMLALLNEGLSLVIADGTYRTLHTKWFAALELPSNRRIVIGGDRNYPPFEYLDGRGRPTGFNTELTRAIAREMELDVEIRLGPWNEIRQALAAGEIDAVQGMLHSASRDALYDFSATHVRHQYVGVTRKGGGAPPAAMGELRGRKIVVQRGDIMEESLAEHGIEEGVSLTGTQAEALQELSQGLHDVALVSRRTARLCIDQRSLTNLVVGRRPLAVLDYGYAALPGQKALLAEIDEGLKGLQASGEYRRIYERWMGVYDEDPPLSVLLRYVGMTAGPLLLILCVAFAWSWSLRRLVLRRTRELRESEQHFRNLADTGQALIWTSDTGGRRDYFNRTWLEFTGRTREQELGDGWIEAVHPEDVRLCTESFAGAFARREGFSRVYRLRRRDGEYRWIQDDGTPRYDSGGAFLGHIGHGLDVTEARRASERIEHLNRVLRAIRDINQLIVRESQLDALIRSACGLLVQYRSYRGALIVLTDPSGRVASYAQAGMDAVFAPLAERLDRGELPPCCERARNSDALFTDLDTASTCGPCPISGDCMGRGVMCVGLAHAGTTFGYLAVACDEGIARDGEEHDLIIEVAGDLGYAMNGIAAEIRHAKLQAQLLQSQKMESVGRLAGGVAHDFNNMLQTILGYSEMALEKCGSDGELRDDLREIQTAARRSADLTRQLLAFARKQTVAPRVMDLNDEISGMLKMLRRLLGENIHLAWAPGASLGMVRMDPSQVDQILANLTVNARDAIEGIGRLTIETQNVTLDQDYCATHAEATAGDHVMLAVGDDGCGMDRETLDKIFDPFFTTKDVDKGTGLGLATVYGIVRQNNGHIAVYSEPGKGTTFKIYLPRCAGEQDAEESEAVADRLPGGRETVLLVEDEASVCAITRANLEALGYTVMAAQSPAQAIRLGGEFQGVIDLLLTDVVMPGMNGRDMARHLMKQRPGLPCIFMSGYTANVVAHHGILDDDVDFLAKPFTRETLAVKVREVLDRRKTP